MPVIGGTVYDHAGAPAAGRKVRLYRRDTGAFLGETLTRTGSVIPGDQHFDKVSLLLHMDGENNSLGFTDKSSSPKGISVFGDARISTAQSRHGGSSLLLPGGGGYLVVEGGSAFNFGSDKFSVQTSVRRSRTSMEEVFICMGPPDQSTAYAPLFLMRFNSDNTLQAYINTSSTGSSVFGNCTSGATYTSTSAFYDIEYTRSDENFYLFVGGSLVASATSANAQGVDAAAKLFIGRDCRTSAAPFAGYVDETRITNLVARNTAAYTPSAVAFYDFPEIPALPVGVYSFNSGYTGEVQRIVLDDDSGTLYNDLIDRIVVAA